MIIRPSYWRVITHRWKPFSYHYNPDRKSLANKAYIAYARKRAKQIQQKQVVKRFLRKLVRNKRMAKAAQATVRKYRGW